MTADYFKQENIPRDVWQNYWREHFKAERKALQRQAIEPLLRMIRRGVK